MEDEDSLVVLQTPGHTPDSLCLWLARERLLFVGDTVYPYSPIILSNRDSCLSQFASSIELLRELMRKQAAPGAFPGDFRNGYIDFGWDKLSPEEQRKKRSIELNNGRAAQMGILALMVHEQLGVSIWPGGI